MNFKIFAVNLIVPLLTVLAIATITGCFRLKEKDSIKADVFEAFVGIWNTEENNPASAGLESFFRKFIGLFIKSYEYEKYKETSSRQKYHFYKLLVLIVILSIPFLMLVLINGQDWILKDTEWNNIYLYTVILVPLIFAYLINKYVRIAQYHDIWYRHLKNRHQMEWRMMVFVKDYEFFRAGLKSDQPDLSVQSLKIDFINDICDYWKAASDISESEAREENIFQDLKGLFSSKE